MHRTLPHPPVARGLTRSATLTLMAIVLAGCGGASPDASFVARADRVCSAARAQARAISQPAASVGPQAQAAYLRRVIPAARAEVSQLQGLRIPQDEVGKMTAYLQAELAQIGSVGQAATALAAGNASSAQADFQSALGLAPRIRVLARSAGLRVCQAEFS